MLEQNQQGPSVFHCGRIFFQSTIAGDVSGWYISMQAGNVYGPFREKSVARDILAELARRHLRREHEALAESA
ncbi:MAG: hypothetical protein GC138_05200 [Gammaproteobacteria bacterium]|nr:hypothetical protein [Gammaproteobacteria bacterium]